MCGWSRWDSSTTSAPGARHARRVRHADLRARRPGDRRGWGRVARGHRVLRPRPEHRSHVQVASGKGPHGDGRRGSGGGAGQRRSPRQLEDPLPRHHARRQVPEPVAHGRAARPGGARPRARAGGMGGGLRPHPGRSDQPAQLRRAQVSPPGARGGPHRTGDHPHPAGPRGAQGVRDLHGVHRPRAADGRRPQRGRAGLLAGVGTICPVQDPCDRPGDRRGRACLEGHLELMGIHRRRLRHGLRGGRRADGPGVHPVPPDWDDLAAFGSRHPGDRRGTRRWWGPPEQREGTLHVPLRSRTSRRAGRRSY